MYAIFELGSHQYRVQEGDQLILDSLQGEPGAPLEFDRVLLLADPDQERATIGTPLVAGARVKATILSQFRDTKIMIQKFRRRKNYRKRRGHRQPKTTIQITALVHGG